MSLFYKTTINKKEVTSAFTKGKPTNTFSAITTFQGNIQSYKGKVTNDQTEGIIDSGLILVFSEEKLNIPKAGTATKGSYVLYHSDWYECIKERDWSNQEGVFESLSYYRYIAAWREADV